MVFCNLKLSCGGIESVIVLDTIHKASDPSVVSSLHALLDHIIKHFNPNRKFRLVHVEQGDDKALIETDFELRKAALSSIGHSLHIRISKEGPVIKRGCDFGNSNGYASVRGEGTKDQRNVAGRCNLWISCGGIESTAELDTNRKSCEPGVVNSLLSLLKHIVKQFNPNRNFRLVYLDDDDDKALIETECELRKAALSSKSRNLYIRVSLEGPTLNPGCGCRKSKVDGSACGEAMNNQEHAAENCRVKVDSTVPSTATGALPHSFYSHTTVRIGCGETVRRDRITYKFDSRVRARSDDE